VKHLPYLLTLCLLIVAPSSWAANRSGAVAMSFDLSAQPKDEVVRLWIPYPVSDRDQTIGSIQVSGDYGASGVYTDKVHGTAALYAEWPKGAASRKLILSFTVERREIVRGDLPSSEPPWNPADYAGFLAPTSLGPTDGAVGELAAAIVKGKRTNLEKARAIYDWTVENMFRDPDTRGCGKGDVCALLLKPGGKCTDISSVFVALCRSAGVPAREIFGMRLGKTPEQDITTWQHCWAEFFVPGAGWVPADPADVRKAMLVDKLPLDSDRVRELRDYFWGGIDAWRFRIATGRDLVLNPPQAAPPLNTFGYPYAEVGGRPLDFYDPKGFAYSVTYREK
jgi:transglutaminase-like putative cysteine protease